MAQLMETARPTMTPTSRKAGGIAGIVFAVLFAIALFLPSPTHTDPIADIRAFFVDSGAFIFAVSWVQAILFTFALVFFAACLRETLASSETVPTEFPRLTFAGGIITAIIGVAITLPWATMAFAEGAVDDSVLLLVMQADMLAYGFLLLFGMALMATAASVVILRTRALARWLGWLGLLSSAMMVIGSLWGIGGDENSLLAIVGFTGVLVWLVWVLGVGIDMVRTKRVA